MSIPAHVAIVMDGNGRWAMRRGYPRVFGHIRGAKRVKDIVREADRLGVKALTLFAFSTENWTRPESEVQVLWKILKKYLLREMAELHARNVRMRVIGQIERLDRDVREVVLNAVERLSGNTGLQLTFALSYGSRAEMVRAARLYAEDCIRKNRSPSNLTEEEFEKFLWTSDLGELSDVDLMIRTSGEHRVSNFLLWQASYAEYCFVEPCWPDFSIEHFRAALGTYRARDRRFGGVNLHEQTIR